MSHIYSNTHPIPQIVIKEAIKVFCDFLYLFLHQETHAILHQKYDGSSLFAQTRNQNPRGFTYCTGIYRFLRCTQLHGVFVLEYHEMTQKGPLTKIDTALGSRDFCCQLSNKHTFIHMVEYFHIFQILASHVKAYIHSHFNILKTVSVRGGKVSSNFSVC